MEEDASSVISMHAINKEGLLSIKEQMLDDGHGRLHAHHATTTTIRQ